MITVREEAAAAVAAIAGGGYRGGGGGRRGGGGDGGRGGGPRRFPQHGNRFADRAGPNSSRRNKDPQQQVLQDLLQMVTKVGALTAAAPPASTSEENKEQDPKQQQPPPQVAVMQQIAQNVRLLTGVVCGSNRALFLRFDAQFEECRRDGLVRWPCTVCTARRACRCKRPCTPPWRCRCTRRRLMRLGTTTATHEPQFLPRTVAFAGHTLARDLDRLLLDGTKQTPLRNNGDDQADEDDLPAHILTRCRLQLRYLALLQEMNVVASDNYYAGS